MALYQDINLLKTRAESGTKLVKRTIKNQQGTLVDEIQMKYVPEEIASIRTIGRPLSSTVSSYDAWEVNLGNFSPDYMIYNNASNLCIAFQEGTNAYYYTTDSKNWIVGYLPIQTNGIPYLFESSTCEGYAIDQYIFLRMNGRTSDCIEFFTSTGITWDSEVSKILSGYRPVPGVLCGLTDTTVSILSNTTQMNGLYEMDFKEKKMKYNMNYITNISSYVFSAKKAISVSTDSIHYMIPSNQESVCGIEMSYSSRLTPLEHSNFSLNASLQNNIVRWLDGIQTHKNSVLLIGLDTQNTIAGLEIAMQYGTSIEINPILNYFTTSVPGEESTVCMDTAKILYIHGMYILMTKNNLYWSSDYKNWNLYYKALEGTHYTYMSKDTDHLYIGTVNDYSGEGKIYRYNLSIIQNTDIPAGKGFLNQEGTLLTGTASNDYNSIFSYGKICNIENEDESLFLDTTIYNKSEGILTRLSQVVFYADDYYYFIMNNGMLQVLKSSDGYAWDDYSGIVPVTLPSDGLCESHWKVMEVEGELYLLRPGMNCLSAIHFHMGDTFSLTVDAFPSCPDMVQKAINVYGTALFYLTHTCRGLICGMFEEGIMKRAIYINEHSFQEVTMNLEETPIQTMDFVFNKDGAVVMYGEQNTYLWDEYELYTALNDIPTPSIHFRKILMYKDHLIAMHDAPVKGDSCLSIYRMGADYQLHSYQLNELRNELRTLIVRDYLPIGDISGNLLILDDYQNREMAFSIDLDDQFNIIRYEDDRHSNCNRFIQSCNGFLFMINSVMKAEQTVVIKSTISDGWLDVTYSLDKYLAISSTDCTVGYSYDGRIWTKNATPYGTTIGDKIISFGDTVLIKIEDSKYYYYSYDAGISWMEVEFEQCEMVLNIEVTPIGFILFAKEFVTDNYHKVYTSMDGLEWTEFIITTVQSSILRKEWQAVACSENGTWVAIGGDGTAISYSLDSVLWEEAILPRNQRWKSVVYGDNGFVAVAENSKYFAVSEDGILWDDMEVEVAAKWISIACGPVNGTPTFVAIAANSNVTAVGQGKYAFTIHSMPLNNWKKVVFEDNKFVAIARNSRMGAYSYDGLNWYTMELPEVADWRYLAYGSGIFIAISDDLNSCATSINGMHWTSETIDNTKPWRLVDYHNEKFQVFELAYNTYDPEYSIEFVASTDTKKQWITSEHAQNMLILASVDGSIIMKPDDSDLWINIDTPAEEWLTHSLPLGIMWSGECTGRSGASETAPDIHVMIGAYSDLAVYTFDEENWYLTSLPMNARWTSIAYGNGVFVAVAALSKQFAYSFDGITWKVSELPRMEDWSCIIFNVYKFVLVARDCGTIFYSYDGLDWLEIETEHPHHWNSIVFAPERYLILSDIECEYLESTNGGTRWTLKNFDYVEYDGMLHMPSMGRGAYHDSIWVIPILNLPVIYRSTNNGSTWTAIELPTEDTWTDIVYVNEYFMILGHNGSLGVSRDGLEWSFYDLAMNLHWFTASYINGKYCVFAKASGIYVYSYDALHWMRTQVIRELIYGNDIFIAFDRNEVIPEETNFYYSHDGLNWNSNKVEFSNIVRDIAVGDGRFVIVTADRSDFIYESPDGLHWVKKYVDYIGVKSSIAYGPQGFVITESDSNIQYLMENRVVTKIYPLLNSLNQKDLTYGDNQYLLLSSTPGTLTRFSMDHTEYETIALDETIEWTDLDYIADQFIVTSSTTNAIMISTDAVTWERRGFPGLGGTKVVGSGYYNRERVPIFVGNNGKLHRYDTETGTWSIDYEGDEVFLGIIGLNSATIGITAKSIYSIDLDNGAIEAVYTIDEAETYEFTSLIYGAGKYFVTTNAEYFMYSYNGIYWEMDETVSHFTITQLMGDNDYLAGLAISASTTYFIYSTDGVTWNISDFAGYNGVDCTLTFCNGTAWALNYTNNLCQLVFYAKQNMLSAIGRKKELVDIISPQKPRFSKGTFTMGAANTYKRIQLDFTPRKLIVRSRNIDSASSYHEAVISGSNDMYQSLSDVLYHDQSLLMLNKTEGQIFLDGGNRVVEDPTPKPRIIQNGFMMICDEANVEFDYFAIS